MKLNNKGQGYIFVIFAIIILAIVMVFGTNFVKLIPEKNTDVIYKQIRDNVISSGKNYVFNNDFSSLDDYDKIKFEKKESENLDKDLKCNTNNVTCKKVPIENLITLGYLEKLENKVTKEVCETNNAYVVVAKVKSNNGTNKYDYYFKIDNLTCGYKRIVNTSETEYYVNEK